MSKEDDYKHRWALGEMADGTINIMTEEEARKAIIQRDADEEAFARMLDGPRPEEVGAASLHVSDPETDGVSDPDDMSDLDDDYSDFVK